MPSGVESRDRRACGRCWLSRGEEFAGAVTEKLLAYALGRGLEYHDRPAVRRILRDSAADDYRWSSIVLGIVEEHAISMAPFAGRRAGAGCPRTGP